MSTPSKQSKRSLRYLIFLFLVLYISLAVVVIWKIRTADQQITDQQISCNDVSDIIGPSDNLMFGPAPDISWMCQPGKICFYDVDNDNQCCETIDQCKKIIDEWSKPRE